MSRISNAKQFAARVVKRGQETLDDEESRNQANDILEEFNIDLDVRVKDNVYTPEKVSNVLFNVSRPTGYKTDEVEKFVDDTEYSIAYYIEYIEDKNEDIHQLANEINQLRTNIENYRAQISLHRARGVAVVDENGEYVKEKVSEAKAEDEDESSENTLHLEEEINNLTEQLQTKTAEFEELVVNNQELQNYADQIEAYSSQLEQRLTEMEEAGVATQEYEQVEDMESLNDFVDENNGGLQEEYIGEVQAQYLDADLSDDVATLQEQIKEFNSWGDEMEKTLLEATEARESAETELEQLREELQHHADTGDLDALQEELTTTTEQFNISEAEKTELYKKYEEVANTVTQQTGHITGMEEYANSLEEENERLEEENKAKDKTIRELQREIKSMKREHTPDPRAELDSDRYGTQKPKEQAVPEKAPTRARKQAPPPPPPQSSKKKLSLKDIMSSELDD